MSYQNVINSSAINEIPHGHISGLRCYTINKQKNHNFYYKCLWYQIVDALFCDKLCHKSSLWKQNFFLQIFVFRYKGMV